MNMAFSCGFPRVVLNFAARCALRCEWCYVPFNRSQATAETVAAIVDRVAALGFSAITFGGGDPFQYPFIERVLRQAKMAGLFVHVDTHGRGLRISKHSLRLVEEAIDLLGLPLDGPTPSVHNTMRSSAGHFELVRERLDWLRPFSARLKINTLLSACNVGAVRGIATLVTSIAPSRWSIYQYWPLGPARRVVDTHRLDDVAFDEAANGAAQLASSAGVLVEVTGQEDRRNTYPIVQHDGLVLAHSASPRSEVVAVGSIFDAGIVERIRNVCSAERATAFRRYAEPSAPNVSLRRGRLA